MEEDYQSLLEQTYLAETGRAPDAEGAAYWGNLLSTGQITPDQLSAAFSGTAEGTAFDTQAGSAGIAGLAGLSGGVDASGGVDTSGGGGGILAQARDAVQNDPSGGVNVAPFINDLYQAVFKRDADVEGLKYYGNALMSGASMQEIEQSLRASKEFSDLGGRSTGGIGGLTGTQGTKEGGTGTVDPRDFLKGKYTSEFGRDFDQPGLDYWADQIGKGNITLEQVANIFSTSPEGLKYDIANLAKGKTDQGFVDPTLLKRYETLQGLYQKEAYRPGEEAGLAYYLGNKNLKDEDLAGIFAASPEARVQDAYREVFGPTRGADEKGLKYYMDQLASGKKYEDIIKAMKASDEYKILTGVAKPPVVVKPPVVNPVTGVTYSNAAQSAKATNFGNFPLTAGTRTNEKGELVPSVSLNLKARPKFNLGLPGFSTLGLTSYQESPASTNIFGGAARTTGAAATPSVVDAAATTDQGVVTAAEGGMIMSDPVMRRAMVRGPGPVSSKGYGITSNVTTPDENAMAMQTMFQPQGFRDGGPVQYFQEGGEAEALQGPEAAVVPPSLANPKGLFGGIADYFTGGSRGPYVAQPESSSATDRKAALEGQARAQMMERRQAIDEQEGLTLTRPERQERREERAPDAERKAPVKDRLTLRLDELKAERQANKAQRRENQLLALMQAGFAAAAGRSPNALANISAGGASGVATLAGLEKDRRAEDTALRREILETELTGERARETAAERQAAREEREFSRQTLGLRAEQDLNARYAIAANAEKRQLNEIIGDNTGKFSEDKKREAASQLTVLEQDLRNRRLKEERLSQALLPPSMREESGSFRASLVGSPRPTSQR